MHEYKVLSERDKKLTGSFDIQAMQAALNAHAAQGWRLSQGFVASNVAKSAKAEIVLILERSLEPR